MFETFKGDHAKASIGKAFNEGKASHYEEMTVKHCPWRISYIGQVQVQSK